MAPPRNIVSLEGLATSYGGRDVLTGVSVGIAEGDRIGVVGANGSGKSTLLRLLARVEEPLAGRVTHANHLDLGLLHQHDELSPDRTIREEVIRGRADHEWAGDPRIRDVLDGLLGGVALDRFPLGLDTPLGPLSGGERRRVALARLLLDGPQLLLLDEPTNHLDIEGVAWLAGFLAARRGALVVVTHDRWFLDAVCTRTWELDNGRVNAFDGGYAAWVLARAERERASAASEERRQNLLRKELAWLQRGPPARSTKPKFRIEAANALIADEPVARNRVELLRFATARLGKSVLDAEEVRAEIGDRVLLRRATWRLGPGDRVGIVGVNGSGKTTFLRLLRGELTPDAGVVRRGSTVRIASLSQDLEEVDGALRVIESLESVRRRVVVGGAELTAGQLCERFGFIGPAQRTLVRDLSGGERRRLQVMRLLLGEPNVLLLDEPTNDLDIDTLNALEDLLDGWPGSLVVVSHDRYFVERVCDDVYALAEGEIRHLPAGIEQYLADRRAAASETVVASPVAAPTPAAGARRQQARKDAQRLERELSRLAEREARLHADLASAGADYALIAPLDEELRGLIEARELLEEAWLEAAGLAES